MLSKIEICQKVVTEQQYTKVKSNGRYMILDGVTANAILKVYNTLKNPDAKDKFTKLEWPRMASLAMGLMRSN